MKRSCRLLLAIVAMVFSGAISVFAQNTPATGTQPIRIRDFPQYVNQDVVVDGITGQKHDDSSQNTKVYSLRDDWGDDTLVRAKLDYPIIGIHYRVEGIIMQEGDGYVLIEQTRSSANDKPATAGTSEAATDNKADKLFGFPRTTVFGIGLIVLALIVGLVIILSLRKQAASTQQMLLDQQRQALERERERIQQSAAPIAAPTGAMTVATDSLPGKTIKRSPHTVEAWGQLKVTSGPHAGLIAPLTGRQVTIGRNEGDLQLADDSMVSTQHAEIVATNDGRLLFVDKSRNGSIVDGNPVHRSQVDIKVDSIIEIGSSRIEIHALRAPGIGAPVMESPRTTTPEISGTAHTMMSAVLPPRPMPAAATGIFSGVEFVAVSGADINKRFPIGKDTVTIGRREDQDIVLTDGFVSREHAICFRRGNDWMLRNLSDKGTTINGEPCTESVIQHGDLIALGATVLELSIVGEAQQRSAQTICE